MDSGIKAQICRRCPIQVHIHRGWKRQPQGRGETDLLTPTVDHVILAQRAVGSPTYYTQKARVSQNQTLESNSFWDKACKEVASEVRICEPNETCPQQTTLLQWIEGRCEERDERQVFQNQVGSETTLLEELWKYIQFTKPEDGVR